MSKGRTRREFLTTSGLGLAGVTAARNVAALPFARGESTATLGRDVAAWVTNASQRFAQTASIAWKPTSGGPSIDAVVLDPDKKFQPILGFGAAFTDAAC